jgi:hypothetical protein
MMALLEAVTECTFYNVKATVSVLDSFEVLASDNLPIHLPLIRPKATSDMVGHGC